MKELLYLVGPPAAGKSTLMRELTAGCFRWRISQPVMREELTDPASGRVVAVELGRQRPDFPGTDALPMNVSPTACAWLAADQAPSLLLAEGDRLAHARFLDAAANAGYRVTVAYLDASDETLAARCSARGSRQSERWRRGRATKSRRIGEYAQQRHMLVTLDGGRPVAELVADLRAALPALAALPEPQR